MFEAILKPFVEPLLNSCRILPGKCFDSINRVVFSEAESKTGPRTQLPFGSIVQHLGEVVTLREEHKPWPKEKNKEKK